MMGPEEFVEALDFALGILDCCDGQDEEDEQYLVMVKERLTELRRRIGVAKAFMDRQKVTVH